NRALVNTGGRYNPAADTWTATSTSSPPEARVFPYATLFRSIIWGGQTLSFPFTVNTGGRYNPSTDTWIATSTTNAPAGRVYHTAVWTGSEMIVWGGADFYGASVNTGGRYNPATDSWIATSTT